MSNQYDINKSQEVMAECIENRFLQDVATHKLTILRDDGIDRHIRFRKPGTICYGFDLLTWPGHLCITGDMGTYVFQRIDDMFKFFRLDPRYMVSHPERKLFINPGYWGEKLCSISQPGGYKEFDRDAFTEQVTDYFDDWKDDEEPTDKLAKEVWKEIEECVLGSAFDGQCAAYQAVYDFSYEEFRFQDFFDNGGTERFTFSYEWGLYAIVWGISQYDKAEAFQQSQRNR